MEKVIAYFKRTWFAWTLLTGLFIVVFAPLIQSVYDGASVVDLLVVPLVIGAIIYGGIFIIGLKN